MTFDPQNQQAPGGFQPPAPGYPQQQTPGFAPQQTPGVPPQQGFAPQQGGQPMFQPSPRPNPFVGIPVTDYLRDGGALLLLLISLALPWFLEDFDIVRGAGRIEVVLLSLLSVLTIGLTYLARAGVFPSSVTVNTVMLLRTLGNAPYILLVLVYLVIDMVSGDSPSGVGYSAALGLAGALLAAQPRQSEVGTLAPGAPIGRTWYAIALAYGALAAVVALISLVFTLLATAEYFGDQPLAVIGLILSIFFAAAAVVFPVVGILRRNDIWRTVAFGFGAVMVGVILVSALDDARGIETVHSGGYLVLFVAGLLGLASSPALRNAMNPIADLSRWFGAASLSLVVVMVVAGYLVLTTLFTLIQFAEFGGVGRYIGSIVVLLLTVGVAVFARISLRSKPAGSRWLVIGLLGGLVLLGIVNVILLSIDGGTPSVVAIGLAFGLPLFIAYALTAPKSVREYFAANAPARPQNAGGYAAAPGYPAAAPAAPGYAAPGYAAPAAPGYAAPAAPGYAAPAAPGYAAPAAPGYPVPPVAPTAPDAGHTAAPVAGYAEAPVAPVPPVAPAAPTAAPSAPFAPPSGAPLAAQQPVAPAPSEAQAPAEAPAPSVAPTPEAPAPSLPPTLPFEADPAAQADEPLSQFSEETTFARPQSSAPADPTPPDAPVVLGESAPESPESPEAPEAQQPQEPAEQAPAEAPQAPVPSAEPAAAPSPFAPPSGDPSPFAAPAAAAPIAPVPPMPAAPADEPATEVLDPAVAEAGDPNSTAEKLFELARDRQDLWPLIAGNPSAYADLLTWFASSDNPEVQAALRARGL